MDGTAPPGADGRSLTQAQLARDVLYRSLFEHAPMEVHVWEVVRDARGAIVTWRLVDANSAALAAWGRRLDDVVGRTTDDIFPGANAVATFLPVVEEIMATGRPREWERDFVGTHQVLRMVSIPVGDYFVSTGVDVTADRLRERALRDALRSLTQATRAGGVGLWDRDLVTGVVRYSDEWKRQLGHEPHEIGDSHDEWLSRVHPDDLPIATATYQAAFDDPTRSQEMVVRMRHSDGSYRWILAQSSFVLDEQGRPQRILGSHIDITDRRRLEERVFEAQRLESLGTLAAGIAHDFNNLLGAIAGNLALLRDGPPGDPETPELLKELDDATQRATALTRQLLTFAKGGTPVRDVTSIHDLLIESARFVTRGSNCACVFDVPDDLPTVEADVGQLSQVINNLVINAAQSMPHGGTIRIGAADARLEPGADPALPPGRYVRLTVADEGTGIPPEHLARIFDPFYTTKPGGSGLGLSTSYAIVAAHGGRIAVESTVGRGTTFEILLPASGAAARPAPVTTPIPGHGRVLVMDDDAAIRRALRRMLERLGYACDAVAGGDEAVARYEAEQAAGRRYHAVILDLTVPGGQGGNEVLPRLRRLDPRLVAIVASGYADDDILADHEAHGFDGRLRKPVDLVTLSTELARVLA